MCAILQLMGQVCNADQISNDRSCCKLSQVRLHQWDFFLYLGTLVQNTQEGLFENVWQAQGYMVYLITLSI